MNIVTIATGFFRPGLTGRILAISEREIYVGQPGHTVKMIIPEFLIELNGVAQTQLCQYGRDFRMATT